MLILSVWCTFTGAPFFPICLFCDTLLLRYVPESKACHTLR